MFFMYKKNMFGVLLKKMTEVLEKISINLIIRQNDFVMRQSIEKQYITSDIKRKIDKEKIKETETIPEKVEFCYANSSMTSQILKSLISLFAIDKEYKDVEYLQHTVTFDSHIAQYYIHDEDIYSNKLKLFNNSHIPQRMTLKELNSLISMPFLKDNGILTLDYFENNPSINELIDQLSSKISEYNIHGISWANMEQIVKTLNKSLADSLNLELAEDGYKKKKRTTESLNLYQIYKKQFCYVKLGLLKLLFDLLDIFLIEKQKKMVSFIYLTMIFSL